MEAGGATHDEKTRGHRRLWRWYWIPVLVAVLGLLSEAMLIWSDQISQRQRTNFALANEIMDLRVRAATSHLWFEEAIISSDKGRLNTALADLREAITLSDTILNGGEAEHGFVLQPLRDPTIRGRAEDIRRLLSESMTILKARLQTPDAAGEGSVLELRADDIFDALQHSAEELENLVEPRQAADYAKSRHLLSWILLAWSSIVVVSTLALLSWILLAWSSIVVVSTLALLSGVRGQKRADEALRRAHDDLEITVANRTRQLTSLNDALTLELTEHKKTEQARAESETQCRNLSFRLLTAQEVERRRISRELHDELGQALTLTKLRLTCIENELSEDQSAARADCQSLSHFIVQIIEDVRRLSRDLSPSVLEDLGLSAALRWLVSRYTWNDGATVVSSVDDVDDLFSPDARIAIYRIVQEAFTNIRKHVQAERVSLTVEAHGDRVSFAVEDDGEGFDVEKALAKDVSEKGFGLSTMHERARMLGASLRVWSAEGKGTRITLDVPLGAAAQLSPGNGHSTSPEEEYHDA